MPVRPYTSVRPVPVCANGASTGVQHGWTPEKAKEFIGHIRWAITERSRAICRGWSKVDPQMATRLMTTMQGVVQGYPCPQPATMRNIWALHQDTIKWLMPYTAAGRKKLARMADLVATL